MSSSAEVLRSVMVETETTQTALAACSGVHQPTISQILAGRVGVSDDQLTRLLACMGRTLQVSRTAITPQLTRSERRSWLIHRRVAVHLDRDSLTSWSEAIARNLVRLQDGTRGEPHLGNLQRWKQLIEEADIAGLRTALVGLDRDAIAMREVSPFAGVISQRERLEALDAAS